MQLHRASNLKGQLHMAAFLVLPFCFSARDAFEYKISNYMHMASLSRSKIEIGQ